MAKTQATPLCSTDSSIEVILIIFSKHYKFCTLFSKNNFKSDDIFTIFFRSTRFNWSEFYVAKWANVIEILFSSAVTYNLLIILMNCFKYKIQHTLTYIHILFMESSQHKTECNFLNWANSRKHLHSSVRCQT